MTERNHTSTTDLSNCHIGVDVGGTFTDVVLFDRDTGKSWSWKVPSTPGDFSVGVSNAVEAILRESHRKGDDIVRFGHGTTVATNAVLERRGPRVGLITTQGFRDVLEIGRQDREDVFDLTYRRPEPLVPRRLRIGVPERVLADGTKATPLDESAVRQALTALVERGAEVVAVTLLHSYVNDEHERAVAGIAKDAFPDLPVVLSSEVRPEYREYERTSTTVTNAFVMPVMRRYLDATRRRLTALGVRVAPSVMQSNGGVLSIEAAGRLAASTLLSGPAAGVVGAVAVAGASGYGDLITFDMGGTSCDVALVVGGRPTEIVGGTVGDFPVHLPMLDIHTVGAGGGSIASVERGSLRVGPESAGADPGPVCYGKGGTRPTVTDAHRVLGTFVDAPFLGQNRGLDDVEARRVLEQDIAQPAGLSLAQAAHGVIAVANDHMRHAIRSVSVQRGHDARKFTLVAYGGAGPLHAAQVARLLGIKTVVIPLDAGTLCARGLLHADVRRDDVRTILTPLDTLDPHLAAAQFRELETRSEEALRAQGVQPQDVRTIRSVDMRYHGQAFELEVDVPKDTVMAVPLQEDEGFDAQSLVERFHQAHEAAYGHSRPGAPVEVVNLRVKAMGVLPKPALAANPDRRPSMDTSESATRPLLLPDGSSVTMSIYSRGCLPAGIRVAGPCVIEQPDATVFVPEGDTASVDPVGNLVIEVAS
ncbi:hydantoinase/oxoprolinase family protein [Rhodococcus sp. NPDC059968]|uniref:hydantoinase/oxoprolinase family protein n=1 Tax=Rhodococcus sp. NPDC059968 TaxID=3347017 RepID=UPI00366D80EE